MGLNEFDKGRIVAYRHCGWTWQQISDEIKQPVSTISNFYSRYRKTGNYARKEGSGRKRKTTTRQDTDILIAAKRQRKITSKQIKQDLHLDVTDRTIRNRLNENGFYSFYAVKKPFISDVNQRKRLQFARNHRNKPLSFWYRVLWSDESPFVYRFNGSQRVWRLPTERYAPYCLRGTVKHSGKIMVWGCFCAAGVGRLYKVKGIMLKEQYHSILMHQMFPSAKKLFPSGNFIFQQDNDPKHTAHINKRYLRNKNQPVLDWPPQSPDLNPIENLWCMLDRQLSERCPQNDDELFAMLCDGWKKLSHNLLKNLVESMPRRLEAVIKAKGMPTKY